MKRGFTLIELIVVIIILGLMALVAFPAITKVLNDSKNDTYDAQVKTIVKAAKAWGVEHPTLLNETECIKVKVATLVSNGYITNGIPKNPKDNTGMNGAVKITPSGNKYNYTYESDENGCSKTY